MHHDLHHLDLVVRGTKPNAQEVEKSEHYQLVYVNHDGMYRDKIKGETKGRHPPQVQSSNQPRPNIAGFKMNILNSETK